MFKSNKIFFTLFIIAAAVIWVLLGFLHSVTESFIVEVILDIFIRLLTIPLIIRILYKKFKKQLVDNAIFPIILCSFVVILDLLVVGVFRFFICGSSTTLFFPACIPICFLIISFYSNEQKKSDKITALIIGIPLLILSLYFEISSFLL